jgi:methyl-accepting chemotaxis protein
MLAGIIYIHVRYKTKFFTRFTAIYAVSFIIVMTIYKIYPYAEVGWIRYVLFPLILIVVVYGGFFAIFFFSIKPMWSFLESAMKAVKGDYSARIDENYADELGDASIQFNNLLKNLKVSIATNQDNINKLKITTAKIKETIENLAAILAQQSSAINETTTTIQELNYTGEQTMEKAHMVVNSAEHSMQITEMGQQAVIESVSEMMEIRQKVERIATQILTLSGQTQKIGIIINKVDEIAEQTNLLSLNASIEAAKAGDAGKGFSVVAAQIRKLAEQSQHAVLEIANIISEIQTATNTTVMATEEGTKGVDSGVKQINSTGELMEQSMESLKENVAYAQQILSATEQQNIGIKQINSAISNINDVMEQISNAAEESKMISNELDILMENMEKIRNDLSAV